MQQSVCNSNGVHWSSDQSKKVGSKGCIGCALGCCLPYPSDVSGRAKGGKDLGRRDKGLGKESKGLGKGLGKGRRRASQQGSSMTV